MKQDTSEIGSSIRLAQGMFGKEVCSRIYFGASNGELRVLLSGWDAEKGEIGATIGSAKLSDTETIERMVRGWVVGRAAGLVAQKKYQDSQSA